MDNDEVFSKEYLEAWNSYLYPGTDVLKNKLGITNQDELDKKEAELSFNRLVELNLEPINGKFDKEHFKAIHKYIFQDLYDWAGEYRTVHMGKNNSSFADYKNLDGYLDYELKMLNDEVKNVTSIDMFKLLIADYFITLLNIHPFRDGNGRATREFLREFTIKKTEELGLGEYNLDWSSITDEELDKYLPLARFVKSPIEMLISKAIVPMEKSKSL